MSIRPFGLVLIFLFVAPVLAQIQLQKTQTNAPGDTQHPEHAAVMTVVDLFFESINRSNEN